MAEGRAVISGPGYKVVVVRGAQRPYFSGDTLMVGYKLLELDSRASILGESIASLLLPPITVEEHGLEVRSLVEYYRFRVVLEQVQDLVMRFGALAKLLRVPPEYPAVARMSLNRKLYPCIFNRVLSSRKLMDEMRGQYSKMLEPRGLLSRRGSLVINRDLIGQIRRILSDIASLVGATARVGLNIPGSLAACEPSTLLGDPGRLLDLPEGRVSLNCDISTVASMALGGGLEGGGKTECRYTNPLSSSLICESNGERFIVKEYTRMQVKWIPASLASALMYKYRVSPRTRMMAEYRNLRALRKVVPTPRIFGVCGTYYTSKMVREYMEGDPVASADSRDHWRLAGEAMARLHNRDIVVGDPNPGNFIVLKDGRVALIDAEQAARFEPRKGLWDLIVFTLYSLALGVDEKLVSAALEEYFKLSWRREQIVKEASRESVWGALALVPYIGVKARRIILDASKQ